MNQGYWIAIEGLEGAGKSTVCQQLSDWLGRLGIQTVIAREPGGTLLGEQLRSIIKQGIDNESLQPMAELLLFYAARAQLLEQIIKPTLQRGDWVISDRHDLSTQAYQGGGRGVAQSSLEQLRTLVLEGHRPDLTLYLDITPEQGLKRAAQRGALDRIEQESLRFFQRIRRRYLELAAADPTVSVIATKGPPGQVFERIQQILSVWLA
ncbi:MAG: dTMP kinase [Candidatus Symbiodolus clandestinus]